MKKITISLLLLSGMLSLASCGDPGESNVGEFDKTVGILVSEGYEIKAFSKGKTTNWGAVLLQNRKTAYVCTLYTAGSNDDYFPLGKTSECRKAK